MNSPIFSIAVNKHSLIRKFIRNLINNNAMIISMHEFFELFHHQFNISKHDKQMNFFILLSNNKCGPIVTYENLIEFGIVNKLQSVSTILTKFKQRNLRRDIDYYLLESQCGPLVCMTALSFKKLLFSSRNTNQICVDTVKYFIILEEVLSFYTDYLGLYAKVLQTNLLCDEELPELITNRLPKVITTPNNRLPSMNQLLIKLNGIAPRY